MGVHWGVVVRVLLKIETSLVRTLTCCTIMNPRQWLLPCQRPFLCSVYSQCRVWEVNAPYIVGKSVGVAF